MTESKPVQAKYHPFFDDPRNERVLRSADGVLFHASKHHLSRVSTMFADMYSSPSIHDGDRDAIDIQATKATLEVFLPLIYSFAPTLPLLPFALARDLCILVSTFQCDSLRPISEGAFQMASLKNPEELVIYASETNDLDMARKAFALGNYDTDHIFGSPAKFRAFLERLEPDWVMPVLQHVLVLDRDPGGSSLRHSYWRTTEFLKGNFMSLRTHFPFPTSTPSWFAGHMARSLRLLPPLLKDIHLVIEARDARLPLTSVNGAFDIALERAWGARPALNAWHLGDAASAAGSSFQAGSGGVSGMLPTPSRGEAGSSSWSGAWRDGKGKMREKVVVYTKRDLAEERYEEPLRKAFLEHANQRVFFVNTQSDGDLQGLLRHAIGMAKANQDTTPEGLKILVVGMPNVGKSSLLNALRRVGMHKGKAFRTSALPGLTRKLTGTVKIHDSPPIYVYDTPGVMLPYLGKGERGAERGLKLALTSGVKEDLWEEEVVVDYLLWRMNAAAAERGEDAAYLPFLPRGTPPTDDLQTILAALASRLGTLRKGGEPDLDAARIWFLRAWREGRMGRWTLDDLEGRDAWRQREAILSDTSDTGGIDASVVFQQIRESMDGAGSENGHFRRFGVTASLNGTKVRESESSVVTSKTAMPNSASLPLDLDARVSLTVRSFLATSAAFHSSAVDAREVSDSGRRKMQERREKEQRVERLRAKGVDVDGQNRQWGMWQRTTRRKGGHLRSKR